MKLEPEIIGESSAWIVVRKPHGMPTAPLREDEQGTLLAWILAIRPECGDVVGKKSVERGLLHRLDTGTAGLVLAAKTQSAYDSLAESQESEKIEKTYEALCAQSGEPLDTRSLPMTVRSQFRAFGPGGREVRPVFPGERRYDPAAREYETKILSIQRRPDGNTLIVASLTRGYRHQIRCHVSRLGYPIVGDRLYNPRWVGVPENPESEPLELCAVSLSFPDPLSGSKVSFSLRQQDRRNR